MTRFRIASVSALVVGWVVFVSACANTPTSAPPSSHLSPGAARFDGNPPPPPVDTASVALTDDGAFGFETTYMLNGPDLAGFIAFPQKQPVGVSISPNARISFHQGAVTGKGTMNFTANGATISVNLATAFSAKTAVFNANCAQGCAVLPFTGTIITAEGVSRPTSGVIDVGGSPALTAGR